MVVVQLDLKRQMLLNMKRSVLAAASTRMIHLAPNWLCRLQILKEMICETPKQKKPKVVRILSSSKSKSGILISSFNSNHHFPSKSGEILAFHSNTYVNVINQGCGTLSGGLTFGLTMDAVVGNTVSVTLPFFLFQPSRFGNSHFSFER